MSIARITLCVCVLSFSLECASQVRIEVDFGDEIVVQARRASVGSNIGGQTGEQIPLAPGTMSRLVGEPIAKVFKGCSASIRVTPSRTRDNIGDTKGRLTGIGIYTSLPDPDRARVGTWFVAPFLAVTVSVRDSAGNPVASVEVNGYEKVRVPADNTALNYLTDHASEIEAALFALAERLFTEQLNSLRSKVHCN